MQFAYVFQGRRRRSLAASKFRATSASTRRRSAAISTSRRANPFRAPTSTRRSSGCSRTGLFSDVRINQRGSTLVVQVDEYSVVNQVLFQGNKKLKDVELATAVQLKPRGSFSQDALNADVEAIKEAYPGSAATTPGHDADHGSRREPRERRVRDQRRRTHQDLRVNFNGNNASATAACRTSSRPSARRARPISCATTSMTRTSCAPTKRRCAASTTITATPISRWFRLSAISTRRPTNTPSPSRSRKASATPLATSPSRATSRRHGRRPGAVIETRSRRRLQRQERRRHDHRPDRESGRPRLCLRAGDAARRPQFREPHHLDRLRDRRGPAYLRRAHRNPRQRPVARLCGPPRVRHQRRRCLQPGACAARQAPPRSARLSSRRWIFRPRPVRSPIRSSWSSTWSRSRPASSRSAAAIRRVAIRPARPSTAPSPNATSSAAASSSASRQAAARTRATSAVVHRAVFPRAPHRGRLRHLSADRGPTTTTRAMTTGGTIRFGLPITQSLSTQLAYNLSQEEYKFDDNCDANGDWDPDPTCNVSLAILDGVASSPWLKSSVSGDDLSTTPSTTSTIRIRASTPRRRSEGAGLGGDAKFMKATARAATIIRFRRSCDIVGPVDRRRRPYRGLRTTGCAPSTCSRAATALFAASSSTASARSTPITGEQLGGQTYFHASAEAQFPLPVVPESFGLRGAVFADAATLFGNKITSSTGRSISRRHGWIGAPRSAQA